MHTYTDAYKYTYIHRTTLLDNKVRSVNILHQIRRCVKTKGKPVYFRSMSKCREFGVA